MRTIYIGYIVYDGGWMPVSATQTKAKAGELMEKYLDHKDPDRQVLQVGGVVAVYGGDYIDL